MDVKMLNEKIHQNGLSSAELAQILGIDEGAFYNKKKGVTDFLRREIQVMKKVLDLTSEEIDSIFFGTNLR